MISKIVTSTEILGAFLSADIGDSTEQLKTDSQRFIAENYGIDLSALDVSVVENGDNALHLSLPYYSALNGVSVETLNEADLLDVAGGEAIAIIVLGSIGGGLAGSLAIGVGVSVGTRNK